VLLRGAGILHVNWTGQCAQRKHHAPEKTVIFARHALLHGNGKRRGLIFPTPESLDLLLLRKFVMLKDLLGRGKERGRIKRSFLDISRRDRFYVSYRKKLPLEGPQPSQSARTKWRWHSA